MAGFVLRWRLLAVLRVTGRPTWTLLWAVNLSLALLPTATGWVTGLLVGRLISDGPDPRALAALCMAVGVLVLASQGLEFMHSALRVGAAQRVNAWQRRRVTKLVTRPGGAWRLEEPGVRDDLSLAVLKGLPNWVFYSFGTGAVGQLAITTRTFGACFAAVVVARFSVPIALCTLAAALFARAVSRREWLAEHAVIRDLAPTLRREGYWTEILAAPWAAKELRTFGLADWALGRFRALASDRVERVAAVRRKLIRRLLAPFALLAVTAAVGLEILTVAMARGTLSIEELALYFSAFWAITAVARWDTEAFDVEFAGLPALQATDRLKERFEAGSGTGGVRLAESATPPRVRFHGVEFRYPGAPRPVLHRLDLEIVPGEVLALVGVNGAGKTTLTDVLTGLRTPTAGSVTVDGHRLDGVDLRSWRRRVSVVFQEFVRYELSLRDNVALGAPWCAVDEDRLDAVAVRAGIADLVAAAPAGWDTPLARAHPGGVDLSGGQWQRVALARALYAVECGARLLVLDEPTAHLDVRAEHEVFTRVARETPGVSVVLISHRLSTVRAADRIAVLDGGRITETGSHDELMALDGAYARMFTMQAERFTDERFNDERTSDGVVFP
ncbi:ABC transporter ATP-binding protein/permease [Actinocorallia sp. API 0066]|uniref:ABC transporter ATP-binding protein n=1 Tax=Actinocorallia sp. API 0066 TaxID=2896846 RepID=UPI001E51F5CE|nr:ABC transporter ATP-binding protein [Actinocorallia sp. API 0066]MCD0451623.1 ABC transporter ATP-binding protein/permease [Actinocorallia sp. API 0066]